MTGSLQVGFIGLGNQGLPIAQMIERAGWPLTVWGRRPESTAPFAGTTARIAASATALAAACDAIGLCVHTDADLLDLVLGDNGLRTGLRKGAILMIHSTVLPETCATIAEALAPQGVGVLDMPVSGAPAGAYAKTLTVMTGGDRALFDTVKTICDSYGLALYLGLLGSGQRMKLLNNAVFMANMKVGFDAIDAAQALGFDLRAAAQVLSRSSGASYALGNAVRYSDNFPDLGKPHRTLTKDLNHFNAAAGTGQGARNISAQAAGALAHLAHLDGAPKADKT